MEENAATAPSEATNESALSPPSSPSGAKGELIKRAVTALVLVAICLPIMWLGGWALNILLLLIAFQMNREWEALIPSREWHWRMAGVAYILLPALSLLAIRHMEFAQSDDASFYATLYPLAMVIATDTGAYFTGRLLGGPKLMPKISPKKTWSGLMGGIAFSIAVSLLMLPVVPWPENSGIAIILAVVFALLAQTGDFFESWLKRTHGAKDSGSLLPGHGGLLARLDGYIIVLPLYAMLLYSYAEFLS